MILSTSYLHRDSFLEANSSLMNVNDVLIQINYDNEEVNFFINYDYKEVFMGADTTRLHNPYAVGTTIDVLLSYGFQRSN